ncbi:hypothetical protein G9A89_001636 [Geosiphon pyriformis]|nr:hypothetical protein G9A89_001636 [Geosiphon pyriformis]
MVSQKYSSTSKISLSHNDNRTSLVQLPIPAFIQSHDSLSINSFTGISTQRQNSQDNSRNNAAIFSLSSSSSSSSSSHNQPTEPPPPPYVANTETNSQFLQSHFINIPSEITNNSNDRILETNYREEILPSYTTSILNMPQSSLLSPPPPYKATRKNPLLEYAFYGRNSCCGCSYVNWTLLVCAFLVILCVIAVGRAATINGNDSHL